MGGCCVLGQTGLPSRPHIMHVPSQHAVRSWPQLPRLGLLTGMLQQGLSNRPHTATGGLGTGCGGGGGGVLSVVHQSSLLMINPGSHSGYAAPHEEPFVHHFTWKCCATTLTRRDAFGDVNPSFF